MAETEMVERVARALMRFYCVDQFLRGDAPPPTLWAHAARAAIEAMREPTAAMRNAGYTGDAFRTPDVMPDETDFDARPVWHAMIDAALSPSKE